MDRSVILQMPANLTPVHELRTMIGRTLGGYPDELREAVAMVTSELVENALKHGAARPQLTAPVFCLSCEDNSICIEVENGIASLDAAEQMQERIGAIASSANKEELYLSRLCELMENSPQVGQLGLYRIGYEGRFELSCAYVNEILSVKATRGLP